MAPSRQRRTRQLGLSACGLALLVSCAPAQAEEPPHPSSLDEAIIRSAARHGIPESLVRRVVMRESKYNPRARNHSFWGLMQISYPTAKSMGFHGTPQELLNPIVNLRYAVPYLANAFVVAGRHQDAAVRLYAHGYYEAAKHRGLLGALRTADSAPLAAVPDEAEFAAAAPPPPPQESGGIFGALFGPSEMPRDAATQQAVYAAADPQPPQAAQQVASTEPAPPVASAAPNGHADDEVALVADKHGVLHPPKAWQRDGGTTVIARGEQSIDKVAAYAQPSDASDAHGSRRRHSHKTTVFASLDAAPAAAQAYAATADGQDPRMMQTESQAAIAQATSGQPPVAPPPVEQPAVGQSQAGAPVAAAAADETQPVKKSRARRTARRGHHHDTPQEPASAVAAAQAPQPAASDEPQPAPAQAAEASAPQPMAAGAPGQGAPSGDPGAAPQQQAADDPADAAPSHKHRHRTRHARAHKATDVAAQTPDDGRPAPAEPPPAQQSETQ